MIKLKIYTPIKKLSEDNFNSIWELLGNSMFDANKFDTTEPLKMEYSKSNNESAYQLVEKGLIVKGKNNNYLSTRHKPTGLTHWIFSLDADNSEEQILGLVKQFDNNLPIVFGMACTEDEYDKKHKVVGESSYGWKGTSMWDFQEFLPGIYWLNIFGKKLWEIMGKEKIRNLSNINYMNWNDDTIAFYLNDPITPENIEARIEKERQIRTILGEKYFFDIELRDEMDFSHPKEFKEYLSQLEKDY